MSVTTVGRQRAIRPSWQAPERPGDPGDHEEPSDAELFDRARAGDAAAIDLAWRRHYPYALMIARRYTRDGADADDLAAEAFVRILSLLRSGRGPREFARTYVARTVRNIATDRSRKKTLPTTVIDEAHDVPSRDDTASTVVSALELADVLEGLAACPPRQRYALERTVFEGVPLATVSDELGISKNAVAALLVRTRESIRRFVARRVHERAREAAAATRPHRR
ncbi:RNA polymerase sigma factor [Myceligenerans pegani]|uniref:Sigma-70 family RNA polymerase sigma factor n=1 Tax=Myceligenerans pegani TaxID=2776917 RepID=A0ABR9N2A7_9MICO|nr:sigma-70 family RNA polymerase sigma factor [Myceligenerans sp. TRM 65318]MBE1877421.1 sigma-70 family RNA polymerase sigma factor [Myceligenerans sp. TRM 65318]MBE3019692.1 sigma-70 family RNA polymerase sigma factor [Myceligenerans sp. TRM 65318]